MRKNLLFVGVFAGLAASVPVLYQANPDAFHAMLQGTARQAPTPDPAPAETAAVAVKVPAAPAPAETLLGHKVRIGADANGHYAGDFRLNGKTIGAMVDTGATLVAINSTTARRIGIGLTAADFKYQVNTANGKTKAASVTIDDLQIGHIIIKKVPAVVLDDAALSNTLVGLSFLNRLKRFQVENGSLVLEQ